MACAECFQSLGRVNRAPLPLPASFDSCFFPTCFISLTVWPMSEACRFHLPFLALTATWQCLVNEPWKQALPPLLGNHGWNFPTLWAIISCGFQRRTPDPLRTQYTAPLILTFLPLLFFPTSFSSLNYWIHGWFYCLLQKKHVLRLTFFFFSLMYSEEDSKKNIPFDSHISSP